MIVVMPDFRRFFAPGGTFFFTVVTYGRRPLFRAPVARRLLRDAIAQTKRLRPFDMPGIVLLPDHLHCLWTLPSADSDFSTRWRKIKEAFTRAYIRAGGCEIPISAGQRRKGLRAVWQQRFWEHTIRDEEDFGRHLDYIHYNPVKHGVARCAHEWAFSSFHRWVREGIYEADWCCFCRGPAGEQPNFTEIENRVGE